MKKCPPGLICINNYVIFIAMLIIIIIIYICGNFTQNIILNNHPSEKTVIKNNEPSRVNNGWFASFLPSFPYTNVPNDVLLNPYAPPLRDERYIRQPLTFASPGMVPINMSTNVGAVDTNYRQVGFLSPTNNKEKLIPLMGRPLYTNRNKWQYYTMSDQRNSIKLSVIRSGRNCTNEYGCDSLYTGERVQVDGLNASYNVTLYENETIKYLPFI